MKNRINQAYLPLLFAAGLISTMQAHDAWAQSKAKELSQKEVGTVISAPGLRGAPPCPAPGNVGLFRAADYQSVITQNMKRDIEICADLVFAPNDQAYIVEGISGIPGDLRPVFGFQGRLLGNGHTISIQESTNPAQQTGFSLGFHDIYNATIQDLVLEVPGAGVGESANAPGYVIGYFANNVTLRNITLKKIVTSAGLFADLGSNLHFDNVRGDITMRPVRGQRRIGAITTGCANCSFNRLNVSIQLDSRDLDPLTANSNFPTYVGGLVAYSDRGFLEVTNSTLTGSIKRGFVRGMIAGTILGGSYPDTQGNLVDGGVRIDNVRIVNADLTQDQGYNGYQAGIMVGHSPTRSSIANSLVRDSRVDSSITAGGLIGGGTAVVRLTGLENVYVRARDLAAGMVAFNSGIADIENSYFRGTVTQDPLFGTSPYQPLPYSSASGLVSFGSLDLSLRNVYVDATVEGNADQAAIGALVATVPAFGVIENAYYNASLARDSSIGTALTAEEMLIPASFAGFLPQIWRLADGRVPSLLNQVIYTLQDLFDFLNLYFANSLQADINASRHVDTQDIFDFLSNYFSRS